MSMRGDSRSLVQRCIYLAVLIAAVAADAGCDKTLCPGPVRYYQDLGCTPVYENSGDCCPVEYNCDHLKKMSKDKCYINGHEYNIDEPLRAEDANPCDKCFCGRYSKDSPASFVCAIVDCFYGEELPKNCFRQNSPDLCCPGPKVCYENDDERATCLVDGVLYKEGEYFRPESDPEKTCYCMKGYKGENIEPFCKKPNRSSCSPFLRHADNIHNHCAPVYYHNQSPQTDCNVAYRCQNENDTVIHNHDDVRHGIEEGEKVCLFGDMVMHLGDELNQATGYESVCVKCLCEVPPVPTCQRLSDSECDVTKHQPFE